MNVIINTFKNCVNIVFSFFRQLQVYRVTMHKHLFMALLLNALLSILFKSFVILEELELPRNRRTIIDNNGVSI